MAISLAKRLAGAFIKYVDVSASYINHKLRNTLKSDHVLNWEFPIFQCHMRIDGPRQQRTRKFSRPAASANSRCRTST